MKPGIHSENMVEQCVWETPPDDPLLSPDEVHIWCVSLNQSDARTHTFNPLLSQEEHERAERFHFARDRRRFIISQGTLRILLGKYLHAPPESLEIRQGRRGKPTLVEPTGENSKKFSLMFNLSHSHELALYATAQHHEIGIDLEYIRPVQDANQIVNRMFSPQEQSVFFALPQEQRQKAFFHCWTRKEAFIKATGEGLFYPLDQFSVEFAPGKPARLLDILKDPRQTERWSLHSFIPAPGYVAALVMEGRPSNVRYWQLP